MIYPVDSVIHPLNNPGQGDTDLGLSEQEEVRGSSMPALTGLQVYCRVNPSSECQHPFYTLVERGQVFVPVVNSSLPTVIDN